VITILNMHATSVAFGTDGVLILGVPGAGKSTLALELIETVGNGLGQNMLHAHLVSDDQTRLERKDDGIWLSAPEILRNKLEVRGLGIVEVRQVCLQARLCLAVELSETAERMPDSFQVLEVLGQCVPRIVLPMQAGALASRVRVAYLRAKSTVAPAALEA
jgi:HPr kinase/phosphorylase